jgi:hypothetical protein
MSDPPRLYFEERGVAVPEPAAFRPERPASSPTAHPFTPETTRTTPPVSSPDQREWVSPGTRPPAVRRGRAPETPRATAADAASQRRSPGPGPVRPSAPNLHRYAPNGYRVGGVREAAGQSDQQSRPTPAQQSRPTPAYQQQDQQLHRPPRREQASHPSEQPRPMPEQQPTRWTDQQPDRQQTRPAPAPRPRPTTQADSSRSCSPCCWRSPLRWRRPSS